MSTSLLVLTGQLLHSFDGERNLVCWWKMLIMSLLWEQNNVHGGLKSSLSQPFHNLCVLVTAVLLEAAISSKSQAIPTTAWK